MKQDKRNEERLSVPLEASDEVLCTKACQGDSDAEELLIRRFSRMVKSCARPYFLVGGDAEDLFQEGMFGLLKAIREYDESKKVPFAAFAQLCISRRIYSAVRAAGAQKHEPLNRALSFDRPLFEDLAQPRDSMTPAHGDPETLVIGNEERSESLQKLLTVLSEFEAKVLLLFLEGLSYEEMASQLHKSEKSVENAIQRIKRKSVATRSQ